MTKLTGTYPVYNGFTLYNDSYLRVQLWPYEIHTNFTMHVIIGVTTIPDVVVLIIPFFQRIGLCKMFALPFSMLLKSVE